MIKENLRKANNELPVCPKCGETTEMGRLTTQKIETMWTGPKTGHFQRKSADVIAYRCPKCGYIELWAPTVI
jgi:predicted RNA-binding Zn-ribbon protein involved in translation (DUF1610 family)